MLPKILKHGLKTLFLLGMAVLFQFATSQAADAATRTWDGGGADENWSTCANWSADTCPTTADIATFDTTSTKNATIDASFTTGLTTFNMNAGYTGIITQARSFTVSGNTTMAAGTFNGSTDNLTFTGTFTLSGGAFNGGNQTVQHTGTFTISSGTYTASSGTTTFTGAYTHTAGGTFTHNSGSVTFNGAATTTNVITTETFNNLNLNKNNATLMTVSSGDTLTVNGTLTLTNGGFTTGTVNPKSTISVGSGWDGGGGTLLIDGSNTVTSSLIGGGVALASTVTLNNANYTLNGSGAGTLTLSAFNLQAGTYDSTGYSSTFSGAFAQSGGTFTGGSGTITHTGAFTLSSGTYSSTTGTTSFAAGFTHTAGGTFTHNNGTVTFTSGAATVDVAVSETFYDLTLNKTANTALTITSGDTLICTHTLTLTEGDFNTGTIEMQGTLSHATTYDGGSGVLAITGSDTKTIDFSTGNLPGINLSNANATLNSASSQTIEGAFTQSAGVFVASSGTTTFKSTLTLSGGTFSHNSGTIVASGATGMTWDVSTSLTLNHFTVSMTTAQILTIASGDTLVVNGALLLTDGALATGTISAKGDVTMASTWDTGSGATLSIDGTGIQTITLNGGTTGSAARYFIMNNANASVVGAGSGTIQMSGVTLNTGSIDMSGYTLNFTNKWDMSGGTFTAGSGTKTFNGLVEPYGFSQTGGTFNGNTSTFSFTGDFTISGGTFNASTGTTTFNDAFTHTAGGVFNNNSGTVNFAGTAGSVIDVAVSETFYNVTKNGSGIAKTITAGDTLIVTGALTLTDGSFNTGTIEAQGNVTVASTYDTGSATLQFSGTADQSFDLTGATALFDGDLIINKPTSGTVTLLSAYTANATGQDFTLTAGAFNPSNFAITINGNYSQAAGTYGTSTAALDINGSFTLSGGTFNAPTSTTMNVGGAWTHTAGGTFTHNNGTVIFDTTSGSVIDVAVSETFYNLTKNGSAISKTITAGDTLIVAGTLTLTDGSFNTGTLEAQGDVSVASTWDSGSTALTFSGTADQSFTLTSATALYDGDVTINKPVSGTVSLTTAFTANATNQDVIVTAGTLSLNGSAITVNGTGSTFVVQSGGTLQLQGGETVTGTPTLNSGSTVKYVGTSGPYTMQNWTYTNATLTLAGGASSVFTLPGTKTVTNLTLTTGIFSLNGNGLTVSGTFNNDSTLRLRGSETVSLTMDADSGTTEYVGDGDAAADTFTLLDFGATDYYNLNVATTDAADTIQVGLLSAKTIAGALTISSGTFDANTNAVTTTGTATVSGGTYSASSATQTMGGLTVSGGTFTGSTGALDVNGNVSVSSGTLTAPSGAGAFTIQGNFTKSGGTFTHNSGTVTFDANANHSITGSVSWNSLTLQDSSNNATDTVLTLESASTQTINGTLTLDGLDADDRLNIVASTPTSAATFDFQGTSTFSGDYLDVTDNTVSDNSLSLSIPLNPPNSINGGNTTNWFSASLPGITVSAISGNTTEAGGTATFTMVLDTAPTNDVVIGLSSNDLTEGTVSPASLTFTNVNWATPQTVTITGVNDDVDDGDIAYSIVTAAATSADTNYNGLNASDVSVTNTDNDTSGFTVSAISGNVAETGTTATYTIVLTTQPTADVSVGISSDDTSEGTASPSSVTFTSLNWSTPQTVTVTGVNDFAVDGTVAFSIVNAAASSADSNYNGVNPADVSVNCTDNDTAGITISAISGNTTEAGGTATFTIVLDAQPTADVTLGITSNDLTEGTVSPASLTFTNVNWATPQTVTVTGVNDDVDDGDIAYSIVTAAATSADTNYNGLNPSDVSVTNTDNDTAGFTVSTISGNTTENGTTASFTVVLNTQPTGNVVINSASNDSTEGQVTSGTALTFTTVNWATPQTVTVTGQDDLTVDGDIAYIILVTMDTGSTVDAVYDAIEPSDVSVTNTDNDTATITVSAISGNTTEAGGTATFTIVLNTQPTADVTLGITSNDLTEGTVFPASLTFTNVNWATPQTVTVTGVNDDIDDGDISYSIVTAAATSADTNYNGVNANDVSAVNTDNDTAGITVTESSGSTDVTEGGATDSYTVVLNTQPTASVVVSFTGSQVSTSSASFTFTTDNWATPQSLTVTALNDSVAEGAHTGTVSHSVTSVDTNYNNYALSSVTANITDNDTAGFSVSAISGTVSESGSTATYTVKLTSQPTADVTIGVSSNDTTEGTVSPASLTFTSGNWNSPQTVTVTGANDFIVDGTVAFSIINAAATSADPNYNTLNPSDVSVSCTDNDTAGFSVSAISGNTTEAGTTATYTINLTSQPIADVTIGITSNDTTEGTVSPASLTFTSSDWNSPQTVTVTGVDDGIADGTIAFSIINAAATSADSSYNGLNPADVSVSNVDNDSAAVIVTQSGGTTAATEGGATDSYTVVLSTMPTNDVTVSFTPNAQITLSTSSFVFTNLDWSTPQTLTVTAVNDSVAEGAHTGSITHAVSSSDSSYNGFSLDAVSVTITDNDTAGITLTESSASTDVTEGGATDSYTVVLTSQPTNDVTVSFTPNAQVTLSAENFVFTALNWATPQTMTVTAANDALAEGTHSGTITHSVSSADTNYNNFALSSVTAHITDNDTAGFSVSTISGTLAESGTTATYTVSLTSQPTADVSTTITSSDTTEGTVSPSFLTFTSLNWSTPQTVTVTGVDDLSVDGTISFTILNAAATSADGNYNGVDPADVSVSTTDNDTIAINLTQSEGSTNVTEAGTTDSYTLVLAATPTSDVTVTLTPDAQITLSASTLTFTNLNWNTPQTITVTAVNDTTVEGTHTGTITHLVSSLDSNYNNFALSSVTVNITDNDTASGGGGGGGSGTSTTNHSKNKDPVKEIQDELESNIPDHWADGYIKNTLEESFIIEVAVAQQSFLDILSSFFFQPNLTTDRSSALQFLLVQSGVDISTITANTNRLSFTDVDPNREDFGPVTFAAQAGLINGYPDGTFQPDRIINRAEALKMVFSFYKQEIPRDLYGEDLLAYYELNSNPFKDVDLDAWYAPYVIAAYHYGIVVGYPDGEFKPARDVSHAEFLKIAILGKDVTQAVDLASVLE